VDLDVVLDGRELLGDLLRRSRVVPQPGRCRFELQLAQARALGVQVKDTP
jgi:hypothetical protein